jgi:SAM-dependent methyltransferase
MPRVIDYEDNTYRTDFWEDRGRAYEDAVERGILHRLLPAEGQRLLEIGAGFGRLSREYNHQGQIVLLDYAASQLRYAREQLGDDGFAYVAADAYHLPFLAGTFDAASMIRVLHHFEDVPSVLRGIHRVLAADGVFILEYANKRNAKAILRHAIGRNGWNPFDPAPVEFAPLNYDFHPAFIAEELGRAGFTTEQVVPASFLRLGILKRSVPTGWLVRLDEELQMTGWRITPSIFTRNRAQGDGATRLDQPLEACFACPDTGLPLEVEDEGVFFSPATGKRYARREGVYDFKNPI